MQQSSAPTHRAGRSRSLAGKSPKARAAELVAGTKLGDAPTRKALFAGGKAAVDGSKDPFIELARLVEPRARELRTQLRQRSARRRARRLREDRAGGVRGRRAMRAYPDGTFTLRLSYGQVKGYRENGSE